MVRFRVQTRSIEGFFMSVTSEYLALALTEGATLEASIEVYDENAVQHRVGGAWRLQPFLLGTLPIASGQIVAGDPGFQFNMTGPFVRRVPPAAYEVWATIAVPDRRPKAWNLLRRKSTSLGTAPLVAFLTLLVTREAPASYELAAMDKADGDRPIDAHPGFGVDSGSAALMDAAHLPLMETFPDCMAAWRLAHKAQQGPPGMQGLAALTDLPSTPPVPVAVCSSGWGDGAYLSYWGLDRRGAPVRLVVDFNLPQNE